MPLLRPLAPVASALTRPYAWPLRHMALLLCAAGMGSALAQAPAPAVLAPAPAAPQSALPSLTASAPTGQNLSELVAKARGYDAQWQAQQADAPAAPRPPPQPPSRPLPPPGLRAGAKPAP